MRRGGVPTKGRNRIHPQHHRVAATVAAGIGNPVVAAARNGRIEQALHCIRDARADEETAAEGRFQAEGRTADADGGIVLNAGAWPHHHHHAVGTGARSVIHPVRAIAGQDGFEESGRVRNAFPEPAASGRRDLLVGMGEAAPGIFGAKENRVFAADARGHQGDIA